MQWDQLSVDALYPYLTGLIRVFLIIVLAFVTSRVLRRTHLLLRPYFLRIMKQHAGGSAVELEKQAATIGDILQKTASTVIWAIAIMMALREVGLDIRPILAGAGIVGLAVGFGAQNLVRDVITGIFMLLENQVRVNDVVIINGTGGLVEEINLRTTVLRGQDGAVHIFPNGAITSLSNLTREFSHYVFDLRLPYEEDTDRAVAALREVAEQVQSEEPYRSLILAPLEVLGVEQLAESAVVIRARIKTMPIQQWTVGREMNRRIKKRFEELGIRFAAPRLSVTMNFLDPASQTALKAAIRQVLREELDTRRAGTPPL